LLRCLRALLCVCVCVCCCVCMGGGAWGMGGWVGECLRVCVGKRAGVSGKPIMFICCCLLLPASRHSATTCARFMSEFLMAKVNILATPALKFINMGCESLSHVTSLASVNFVHVHGARAHGYKSVLLLFVEILKKHISWIFKDSLVFLVYDRFFESSYTIDSSIL
jgi:hypothetical protein